MKTSMSFTREELSMLIIATEALRDERADRRDQTARVARLANREGFTQIERARVDLAAEQARQRHLAAANMVGRLKQARDRVIEKSKREERESRARG